MYKDKKEFINRFKELSPKFTGKNYDNISEYECFVILCNLVKVLASEIHNQSRNKIKEEDHKDIYYFSMEFLIGKLLKVYLINLGIKDVVEEGLKELNFDLDKICEFERDPGLGNGGLGRLAACFMDSMASLGIRGMGMGVRYRFGLFKQKIVNGEQIEVADNWLDRGYPWEKRRDDRIIKVKFGGVVDKEYKDGKILFHYRDYEEVLAVPYDVPVVGFGNTTVNTLRLWYAQPSEENFDLTAFNNGDYSKAVDYRNKVEAISSILYPDDSNSVGKRLRLQQEYLLVAAGVGDIVNRYKRFYGTNWADFSKHVAIHINDTHPTMCIPELMRILLDEEGLEWDEAFDITVKTIAYTNHTVLPEALEKWPIPMMKENLPRIYMIIEEINRRYNEKFDREDPEQNELLRKTAILWDNNVYMANLSIICSHSVNGVAALHTEILKKDTLKSFYQLEPQKFNNKTNGVSHRRFLLSANNNLCLLLKETIGDGFRKDADKLKDFEQFADNKSVLDRLSLVKYENKLRMANYIKLHNNIIVDPHSIFDIQVKRIHAYKRQMLFAFKVLNTYNELKAGKLKNFDPHTYIFAGKAAGSYAYAKKTIKFVNSLADIINNDKSINDLMKVVFIENFCVSNAELIYPAAEISEQISTAGKEASGTGNMKFMFNGAITLGTMDGANVEINHLVGDENMRIFGLREEEIEKMNKDRSYDPNKVAEKDERIKLIKEQLINGFFKDENDDFWDIYDSFFTYGDEYFVIEDLADYIEKSNELDEIYKDKYRFNKMSLINIARAGFFSSDRTIKEYYNEIWKK